MRLRSLRLGIENINTSSTKKSFIVVDAMGNRVRKEDGGSNDKIDAYCLICSANRGDTIKVKVPLELEQKVTEVMNALEKGAVVSVVFTDMSIKAYAMKGNDGRVISGVVASASDFNFDVMTSDDIEIEY